MASNFKNKKKIIRPRIPLPKKKGGYHSTKKGKKGYDRKEYKKIKIY